MHTNERIKLIVSKLHEWISPRHGNLEGAIEKTVDQGLFPLVDIRHAVRCHKKRISEQALRDWAKKAGVEDEMPDERKILCLHAGNLPLVGLQDVIACMVSGVQYFGKISRKDPHLIPAFLRQFHDTPLSEKVHTELMLESYENLEADAVTFSGSDSTVPEVKSIIRKMNIADEDARFLIRSAHFSIAYIDKVTDKNGPQLAEAILRYNGRGCRSVAVIVSPLSLSDVAGKLTSHFETYWTMNPTWKVLSSLNRYRFAYNRAVGKEQLLLEHLIIEEGMPEMNNDEVIYWVRGNHDTVRDLAKQFGSEIQNIYITGRRQIKGMKDRVEPLENAQCPPINWKPDGVDVLAWLQTGTASGTIHFI